MSTSSPRKLRRFDANSDEADWADDVERSEPRGPTALSAHTSKDITLATSSEDNDADHDKQRARQAVQHREVDIASDSDVKSGARPPGDIWLYVALVASAQVMFGYEATVIAGVKRMVMDAASGMCTSGAAACSPAALTSGMPLGAACGAALATFFQSRFGRRRTLVFAAALHAVAGMLTGTAMTAQSFVGGRVLTGLAIGIFSSTCPLYIAELSPRELRGALVTASQVGICTGSMLGYITTMLLAPQWRQCIMLPCAISVLLAFCFVLVTPSSPRWLVVRGETQAALVVLRHLRGSNVAAQAELAEIQHAASEAASVSVAHVLTQPHVIWAIMIGVVLASFQQACGINAVNAYVVDMFLAAGVGRSEADVLSILVGGAKLAFVLVALALMDRVGRRKLLLIGFAIMFAALMTIALVSLKRSLSDADAISKPDAAVVATSMIVYMAGFEIGAGPIFWVLVSELCPLQGRTIAMGIAGVWMWVMSVVVVAAFPSLHAAVGGGVYVLFAIVCAVGYVWSRTFLFETKGRSLEDIESALRVATGEPTSLVNALSRWARSPWQRVRTSEAESEED